MARWPKFLVMVFLLFWVFCLTGEKTAADQLLLKIGSSGNLVRTVQNYLQQLNYLKHNPTGYYGPLTREAVKSFQLENGLEASGITGMETFNALQQSYLQKNSSREYIVSSRESLAEVSARYNTSIAALMVKNNLSTNEIYAGQKLLIPMVVNGNRAANSRMRLGVIQPVPWSIVDLLWKKGEIARIIDVDTGKSLQVKRLYGHYHADVEPLTRHDTQVLKEIYGGVWSWNRRAVIVQIHNMYLAASINGMPHGGRSIYDNDFPGQFCAHFLGSRVHNHNKVDPAHQAMVQKAAQADFPAVLNARNDDDAKEVVQTETGESL